MTDSLAQYGLGLSVLLFVLLATLEAMFPRKKRSMPRGKRWRTNIIIIIVDSLALRLMGPVAAISAAIFAEQNNFGLFNWITLPGWLEFMLALILLDLAIYAQHVISHKVPLLWALHKVHHADRDIDVTTAVRFHPLEIILSMLYKCAVVLLLGPSAVAVFVFALLLNLCAMFNHANLRLPESIDKILRLFVVTPDMHRVHHSTVREETDSNFGFSISLWDRLLGTYTAQPAAGHDDVVIGLDEYQSEHPAELWWSLVLPFHDGYRSKIGSGYNRNSS
ncbi:sterol desaturase family protein [Sphingorhabdus sp. M41]|uniref:sterol desaturase family protein n=1 Tax=Sphingorhabdus sp. M41 TaxID=1806885 RepID=UPI00078B35B5|nr:sterol desaturase family protein [Sphingorhabdus sp. M41]AMO71006.1 fatty acid hydroxylase [Sphingorhabdus sp. M41]